jgi:hypothetical protein
MQTISIRADDIELGERHRALSEDAVQRLAASMKDIGLKQPISVRVVDEMVLDGQLTAGVPVLVAGAHRLAAAKALGWSHIDCIEVEDDAITAELWELAENLHRHDLTTEQRNEHIRRYAELLEARARIVPQSGEELPVRPVGRPKSINQQIADATGLGRETVRRALKPASRRVIEVPDQLDHDDMVQMQVRSLMAAWNKSHIEARELFLEQIDAPVFERTRAA